MLIQNFRIWEVSFFRRALYFFLSYRVRALLESALILGGDKAFRLLLASDLCSYLKERDLALMRHRLLTSSWDHYIFFIRCLMKII